ncbi:MAG: dipeptidase [Actinomycetota bacterium]
MSHPLHERAVVVDCHNDLILLVAYHYAHGRTDYFRDHWIPELRRGGVDVQVVPIFIEDEYLPEGGLRRSLQLIELFHQQVEANHSDVALCVTGADIEAAVADGKIALVLALEGCRQIGTSIELFDTYFRLGVRMASFTHFGRTMLADGTAEATNSRLTAAGVSAVEAMQQMGMLLDVSHLSLSGVDHVLEISTRPVIASHSNAMALREHHRNLPDEHLKAIAASGGVIGVNMFAGFLDPERPALSHIVDQVEYIAQVAGIDHVGFGPDFVTEYFDTFYPNEDLAMEGMNVKVVPEGTEGSSRDLPLVTQAMLDRSFTEEDVVKVAGANFLRVFRSELGTPATVL